MTNHHTSLDNALARAREARTGEARREGECDHPGIGHGAWSYTGVCPRCGFCKFIGHGPFCSDCYCAPAPDQRATGHTREGETA